MYKSILIKDTTKKQRQHIVDESKQITKLLGKDTKGISDEFLNLYIEGKMELKEAKEKFIEAYIKGELNGKNTK